MREQARDRCVCAVLIPAVLSLLIITAVSCSGGSTSDTGCVADSDCPEGQKCISGVCKPEVTQVPCEEDEDCGRGMICLDGFCVSAESQETRCSNDFECPEGNVCKYGKCVPLGGGGAERDAGVMVEDTGTEASGFEDAGRAQDTGVVPESTDAGGDAGMLDGGLDAGGDVGLADSGIDSGMPIDAQMPGDAEGSVEDAGDGGLDAGLLDGGEEDAGGDACVPHMCIDYSTCSQYTTCDPCPPKPEEICNGKDDDCDPSTLEEGRQLDCPAGEVCRGGACCTDECPAEGMSECVDNDTAYRICGNFDTSDECLEWSQPKECSFGCENGKCKGCTPDCTGKECGDDGCGGSCGECNSPPPDQCVDSNTKLRVYEDTGQCLNNKCSYNYMDTICTYGCDPVTNKCKGCTPKTCAELYVESKACGNGLDDGCGGTIDCPNNCGAGEICQNHVCVECGGVNQPCCENDFCGQGAVCQNGTCMACGATNQPCCQNDLCNSDHVCLSGVCKHCGLIGEPCCAGDLCTTGAVCQSGVCVACGGTNQPCCDNDTCNANHICQSGICKHCGLSNEPCCLGNTCDSGFICQSGICKHCGLQDEPCCDGNTCEANYVCQSGKCTHCGLLGEPCCDATPRCSGTMVCYNGSCCKPKTCAELGKECGGPYDDGCGGQIQSCGVCTQYPNSFCNASGHCDCTPDTCESLGYECGGPYDNGCGGQIDCGYCDRGSGLVCIQKACIEPPTPLLQVSGQQLVDINGDWVRIRGTNYNRIDFTTKLPPLKEHIKKIKSWGFNVIRYPINWSFLEPSAGNIDWSYVDEIEDLVRMAGEQGIYVVIDMHQWNTSQCFTYAHGNGFPKWFVDEIIGDDCYNNNNDSGQTSFWHNFWSNPVLGATAGPHANEHAWDVFGEAWRHVAWRLRNYKNVVGWDILNEPYSGGVSEVELNSNILPSFYETVGNKIRLSDTLSDGKHHVLFIEGQDGDIKPSMSKPDLNNIVLSPHLYTDPEYWDECQFLSSVAHRGLDKGASWNIPVFFGEFGATSLGDGPEFADHVSRIIGANGQSWAWWNFGPRDGLDNMELVDSNLNDKPVVQPLLDNLLIFDGDECP